MASPASYLAIVIFAVLVYVSVTDCRSRTIKNEAVLVLLPLQLAFAYLLFNEIYFIPAIVTLVVGFLLFMLRVIGAGDVKLLSVLMLAVPADQVIELFLYITVFGLVEIIIGLIFFRHAFKTRGVPYGVAISLGYTLLSLMNLVPQVKL
ncbi:hypothetical protein IX83_02630 [Basilea psittacipulmonis DSM 24701]|uniref:Prepilin type IV endopeptidase peptidase domain-containing protein n=2 Tax=Basilea TaxID=1472344 RepID=A0A077DG04_9BURK|nr:hypothetical protein IX83_02630 [Basilea psittacipulmonis DSM 24701]